MIFALTQGANDGWGKAGVIAPLVISVVMIFTFFVWEWQAKETDAAL
jgi:hypothetical protein